MYELTEVLNTVQLNTGDVLGREGSYMNSVLAEVRGRGPRGIISLSLLIFVGGLGHAESWSDDQQDSGYRGTDIYSSKPEIGIFHRCFSIFHLFPCKTGGKQC